MRMSTFSAASLQPSPSAIARTLRQLRGLCQVPGWRRLVKLLAPPQPRFFLVSNRGVVFAGSLDSYIDREIYFYGGYESRLISDFVAMIPLDRRRVCLDVGGNVGNHALQFAKSFQTVFTFEPNPAVLPALRHNVSLNP